MADNIVTVILNAIDKASPVIKKAGASLKQLGETTGRVGMNMTALFTVPVLGAIVGLNKMGKSASDAVGEAAKAVSDAQAALAKAMRGDNQEAIIQAKLDLAAATLAYKNLSPEILKTADAYNKLQAELAPVQAEFQKIGGELMTSLLPVLKDLMPTIKDVVGQIHDLVKAFTELPVSTRTSIIEFIGLAAVVGPILIPLSKLLTIVGTIISLLPGLASGIASVGLVILPILGPLAVLIGLLGVLYKQLESGTFNKAVDAAQKLVSIGMGSLITIGTGYTAAQGAQFVYDKLPKMGSGGSVLGGRSYLVGEQGPEVLTMGGNGYITPNNRLGGNTVNIVLPAEAMFWSDQQIQRKFEPIVKRIMRGA